MGLRFLLPFLVLAATPDRSPDRALMAAARRGDAAQAAQLIRAGADVNATSAAGGTALLEAVSNGRLAVARLLLDAGADVDARHRELGTALDVAERSGDEEMATLLRARGARGSGKSIGDTVCVRLWAGSGYCGTVEERHENLLRIGVRWLEGCQAGCAANRDCSAARSVGGAAADAIREGASLPVPSWCLTQTGVRPRP